MARPARRPVTHFGKQVNELLAKRKENEEDLAARAGVSPSHLYRVLRGDKGLTDELLADIADALDVDEAHFAEAQLRCIIRWLDDDPKLLASTYRRLAARRPAP